MKKFDEENDSQPIQGTDSFTRKVDFGNQTVMHVKKTTV